MSLLFLLVFALGTFTRTALPYYSYPVATFTDFVLLSQMASSASTTRPQRSRSRSPVRKSRKMNRSTRSGSPLVRTPTPIAALYLVDEPRDLIKFVEFDDPTDYPSPLPESLHRIHPDVKALFQSPLSPSGAKQTRARSRSRSPERVTRTSHYWRPPLRGSGHWADDDALSQLDKERRQYLFPC